MGLPPLLGKSLGKSQQIATPLLHLPEHCFLQIEVAIHARFILLYYNNNIILRRPFKRESAEI